MIHNLYQAICPFFASEYNEDRNWPHGSKFASDKDWKAEPHDNGSSFFAKKGSSGIFAATEEEKNVFFQKYPKATLSEWNSHFQAGIENDINKANSPVELTEFVLNRFARAWFPGSIARANQQFGTGGGRQTFTGELNKQTEKYESVLTEKDSEKSK